MAINYISKALVQAEEVSCELSVSFLNQNRSLGPLSVK